MLISKTGSSIWTMCVCYASATLWTWFVIICDFVCVSGFRNYLWNVNVWCVMLNDAILVVSKLVWNPSWFRLTIGIIWAQVRKFERFGACFCTCALIIWSVLLQVCSRTGSQTSEFWDLQPDLWALGPTARPLSFGTYSQTSELGDSSPNLCARELFC
jgi:hypothetical protein